MKTLVMVAGCLFFAAMLFAGCEKAQPTGEGPGMGTAPAASPTTGTAETPRTPGTVATVVVGSQNFSVEVAQSDQERQVGLQGRQEPLATNAGMWFIFPSDDRWPFWMKDTHIPLDQIFVKEDPATGQMTVVDIRKNSQPNDETPYRPTEACRYVLEVNGGTVDAKGLKIGDVVQYRIGN